VSKTDDVERLQEKLLARLEESEERVQRAIRMIDRLPEVYEKEIRTKIGMNFDFIIVFYSITTSVIFYLFLFLSLSHSLSPTLSLNKIVDNTNILLSTISWELFALKQI